MGEELGRGLRSVVHAWGETDVVKIPNPSTPESWLAEEFRLLDAAERAGARVPGRRRIVMVGETRALASERIFGPSLWDLLVEDPDGAAAVGARLAAVQARLAACTPGYELPAQRDRLVSKIHLAAAAHGAEFLSVLDLVPPGGQRLVLCHGDLHPRNVLLGDDGPVLVDWFDASRGVVGAEIARTALMLEVSRELGDRVAPPGALTALRDGYLDAVMGESAVEADEVAAWSLVQSVARLAEGLGGDRAGELRGRVASAIA